MKFKFSVGDEVVFQFTAGEQWHGTVLKLPCEETNGRYEVEYTDQFTDFDLEERIRKLTKLEKALK